MELTHWSGRSVTLASSKDKVLAFANVWDNFIRSGLSIWPPPELVQKLYQSRHANAFVGDDRTLATSGLKTYYCDLQSVHSEDAVTWNCFGPLIYATSSVREEFARSLLELLQVPGSSRDAYVWLWRRIPHPDTLVPGGPEIDVGIITRDTVLLGEAKWLSGVGKNQGVNADKDQIILRKEFCLKYGDVVFPEARHLVVFGISIEGGVVTPAEASTKNDTVYMRDTTWKAIGDMRGLPHAKEFLAQLSWRLERWRITSRRAMS